jgi:hypothetical protein
MNPRFIHIDLVQPGPIQKIEMPLKSGNLTQPCLPVASREGGFLAQYQLRRNPFLLINGWALMRAFWLTLLVSLVGCSRPGIDETPHARPTQADRRVAEENWQQLERAYSAKNLESARPLIGKPILFVADVVYHSGIEASARRARIFSDPEEDEVSRLPMNENYKLTLKRLEALPKIPCKWEFTRLQKRMVRDCCSMGLEVYATLRSVSSAGIEVESQDFGTMMCL